MPIPEHLDWMSAAGLRAVFRALHGRAAEEAAIKGLQSVYERECEWVHRLFEQVKLDLEDPVQVFDAERDTAHQTILHSIDSSLQQLAIERNMYLYVLGGT